MRMKQNPCIRRGGCYWVENLNAVGHEMMKTRPAVVVSCGALAGTSPVVNIVYLSNTDKDREGYVRVRTEKGLSVAHCENIYSVDKSRLGTYLGQCGEDEMAKIDAAILRSLGIAAILRSLGIAAIPAVRRESEAPEAPDTAAVERDIYRRLYEGLLDRMRMDRRETA